MGDGALDKFREAIQADLRRRGYAEAAVQHATLPVNQGDMAGHSAFGIVFDDRGHTMAFWLKLDSGAVSAATFAADGDDALTACGSVLTEMVTGKTLGEAGALTGADIDRELGGLPEEGQGSARLAMEALQNALEQV